MVTKQFSRALAVGVVVLTLAGCVAAPPPPDNPRGAPDSEIRLSDEGEAGTPVPGGRLNFLMRLEPSNIDPHLTVESAGYVVAEQIYESLLESVRGELVPALATEWDISSDGLTYTFKLRKDATFHSGRPVTAEDVKYSLERVKDPATASPRARSYDAVTSIAAKDQHTVVITLETQSAPMLALLSTVGASIVDRTVVESSGLNGEVDGGTGPFVLSSRVSGQKIGLDRNPEYWVKGVPYLDGVDVTWSGDDNARAAAIRSGTADFLWRAAPEFIESMKADKELKWYGGAGTLSLHLRLNTSKEPFSDVKVRQAIYNAIDRQELVDTAISGQGTALYAGYLPPDRFGAVTEPIYGAPDLDKSRKLLADAGYEDGFDATIMAIATSAFQTRQAEVLQQQLAKIGIDITLDFIEGTTATARTNSNDFDMYQTGYTLSADPDERLSSAFATGGGANYGGWSDAEYDKLLGKARGELDDAKRSKLYQQAETILAERGPVAMTFVTSDFDVVRTNVMGYHGDTTPSFRFYKNLWLAK